MGTGQTLLVLGAMILLGIIALSVNRTIVDSDSWLTESKLTLLATNVAQELIEEALGKKFDENDDPAQFTAVVALGPEGGEASRSDFDDVDDYSGYLDMVSTPAGVFLIEAKVDYVQPGDPDNPAPVPTSYKKIVVTVSSQYLEGDIKLEQICAYHGEMI